MSSSSKERAVLEANELIASVITSDVAADQDRDEYSALNLLIDKIASESEKSIWIEAVNMLICQGVSRIKGAQWRRLEDLVLLCSLFDTTTLDVLENSIAGKIHVDASGRLFMYHVLARGGRRVLAETLSREGAIKSEFPCQWFDLMQEALPFLEDRRKLLIEFVRDGTIDPNKMSARLELVRSLSGQFLSDLVETLTGAAPSASLHQFRVLFEEAFGIEASLSSKANEMHQSLANKTMDIFGEIAQETLRAISNPTIDIFYVMEPRSMFSYSRNTLSTAWSGKMQRSQITKDNKFDSFSVFSYSGYMPPAVELQNPNRMSNANVHFPARGRMH